MININSCDNNNILSKTLGIMNIFIQFVVVFSLSVFMIYLIYIFKKSKITPQPIEIENQNNIVEIEV